MQFLLAFTLALIAHNVEGIMDCKDAGAYLSYMDSKLKLPEDAAQVSGLIKLAIRFGKKLDYVSSRWAEEVEKMRDMMMLNNKLRWRKTRSVEVLTIELRRIGLVSMSGSASGVGHLDYHCYCVGIYPLRDSKFMFGVVHRSFNCALPSTVPDHYS